MELLSDNLHFIDTLVGWNPLIMLYWPMLQSGLPFSKKQSSLYVAVSQYHFRDQSYVTRIQLAVLDHNNHLNRDKARNKQGELMYARKFRKQTKKWDATPVKERKRYSYIPDLLKEIENMRTSSPHLTVKRKRPIPSDHPARLQPTIGNTIPNNTLCIVRNKKSRFQ